MIKGKKTITKGIKASVGFFVASLITSGLTYLTTPIYTRLLTSEEYGQLSIYLTWLQIFGIISMFCLSAGVFNNGMIEYPNDRDDYSFSMLILSNIITLCVSAIILCLYPLISAFLQIEIPLLLLMFILFLVQPAYNFWVSRQRYELKYKKVLFFSVFCALMSPAIAILLMLTKPVGERLFLRIFGGEVVLIIIYIGFYIYLGCKNKWTISIKYWKKAFLFNLPLIPHYLSSYLLGSSDKIMISYLIDDTSTAYYSIAHSIATVAIIMWNAINASLIPFTYEKCKEERYGDINKVTLPLISIFALGCVIVIMMAPEAVGIMATTEYMEAIYVIPPVVGGVFFQVQYYLYANILYYHKKPVFVMAGSVFSVSLNLLLNYFCIKRWGYMAAGYTTIICYGAQAIIDFFAMKKVVGKSIYNTKFIMLLSIIVVAIALTSNLIYDFIIIRYSIVLIIIVLVIFFRKRFISIFSFANS